MSRRSPGLGRREFLLLGGGLLAAHLTGCASESAPGDADEPLPPPEPGRLPAVLRIGAILPAVVDPTGPDALIYEAVAEAARMGTVMAGEESAFNAQLFGVELEVRTATATDEVTAREIAERFIGDGAYGLTGGFGTAQAQAISQVAETSRVPFLNVGAPSDELRNESCSRYTFHVEPSAAMYLDALAGWFVRAGFRRWFFVYEESAEGEDRYRRTVESLSDRHFGAREVGARAVASGRRDYADVARELIDSDADLALLLLPPERQLAFLRQFSAPGRRIAVTGFPEPACQTRTFYAAAAGSAADASPQFRAAAWESSLDAYGARELNARFHTRWGRRMDGPAWSAFQGIRILLESALARETTAGPELVAHLRNQHTIFDVWKGIGTSFRPWDHQLRQSLFLVEVGGVAESGDLEVRLAGELPAIYMPGTDPVERLDQLGDLQDRSRCRFR